MPASSRGNGRILVMDDEDFIRDVARSMLQGLGYTVETASHGAEALDMFTNAARSGKPFDLVILDLTIPGGMGGKKTKEELRKIAPSLKIIASSGYSDDPVIAHPGEFGFDASIRKPYHREELAETVLSAAAGLKKPG